VNRRVPNVISVAVELRLWLCCS